MSGGKEESGMDLVSIFFFLPRFGLVWCESIR